MSSTTLTDFRANFVTEINQESNIEGYEKYSEEVFTERISDILVESGVIDNPIPLHYATRGIKISGYDLDYAGETLSLIVSDYEGLTEATFLAPKAITKGMDRAFAFYSKSLQGLSKNIDPSSEARDLANTIAEKKDEIKRLVIILATDRIIRNSFFEESKIDDIQVIKTTWDINRIFRFETSGKISEPVNVGFEEDFETSLYCTKFSSPKGSYTTYVGILPGKILYALYEKWGIRILERNIRAYLQAKNRVNKGIRDTIIQEPWMFLAYNNGITLTAESVDETIFNGGSSVISAAKDIQIVNGGQTCASIWHAVKSGTVDLDQLFIPFKLTIMKTRDSIDQIAPNITRYANAQNAVNLADFYSNSEFHIAVEKLSRAVWASRPDDAVESKWFYERSRGSYNELRNLEITASRKRAWDAVYPRNQKFDKLLLGKVEVTWNIEPHLVSRGAQKNFYYFSEHLQTTRSEPFTEKEYKYLIAKIIIWKQLERIVSRQKIPGFRANIVTYSFAFLLFKVQKTLDLEAIWRDQEISEALSEELDSIAHIVRNHITNTSGNITEWCKSEKCWNELKNNAGKHQISKLLKNELLNKAITQEYHDTKFDESLKEIRSLGADFWFGVSKWGKISEVLTKTERSQSYNVGVRVSKERPISRQLAKPALMIMEKAMKNGFEVGSTKE